MHEGVCHPGYNSSVGHRTDEGTSPPTLPSFFPELQKIHVGLGPAFLSHKTYVILSRAKC